MRTCELYIAAFALLALAGANRAQGQGAHGIGRTATPAEIAGWNIDIDRDGNNLPPGSGSVSHGHEVFDQQCASCHGAKGEGGLGDRLVGGQAGHHRDAEAGQDRRQLLALRPDVVRLYPPRHASERAAVARQ